MIEYEAPPSISPSPATTPGPNRVPSSGNLIPGQASSAEVPAQAHTYASPAPVTPARPVNVHASVNLLDMDDHVLSPTPSVASQSQPVAPAVGLVECAGRFTPVLFQQLWGQLGESFAGQVCTLGRLPGATSELEAALRTQKVGILILFCFVLFCFVFLSCGLLYSRFFYLNTVETSMLVDFNLRYYRLW